MFGAVLRNSEADHLVVDVQGSFAGSFFVCIPTLKTENKPPGKGASRRGDVAGKVSRPSPNSEPMLNRGPFPGRFAGRSRGEVC